MAATGTNSKNGRSLVLTGAPGGGENISAFESIADCLQKGERLLLLSGNLSVEWRNNLEQTEGGVSHKRLCGGWVSARAAAAELCRLLGTKEGAADRDIGKATTADPKADSADEHEKEEKFLKELLLQTIWEPSPVIEKSLYELYEQYRGLGKVPEADWDMPGLEEKGWSELEEISALLTEYAENLPSGGSDFRRHPWYGFCGRIESERERESLRAALEGVCGMLQRALPLMRKLSLEYEVSCRCLQEAAFWEKALTFLASSRLVTAKLLRPEIFNEVDPVLSELREMGGQLQKVRGELLRDYGAEILEQDGTGLLARLKTKYAGKASRLWSGEYKRLIAALRRCRKDAGKMSYEEACQTAALLAEVEKLSTDYAELERKISGYLGPAYQGADSDWDYIMQQMDALYALLEERVYLGKLPELKDLAGEQDNLASMAEELRNARSVCSEEMLQMLQESFDTDILDLSGSAAALVLIRLKGCLLAMDHLEEWQIFYRTLSQLLDRGYLPFLRCMVQENMPGECIAASFQKSFLHQWMDRIIGTLSITPSLVVFDAAGLFLPETVPAAMVWKRELLALRTTKTLRGDLRKENGNCQEKEKPVPVLPPYKTTDLQQLQYLYFAGDLQTFVRGILEIEAPLSEELLLKRIVWWFGKEKVTSGVLMEFQRQMKGCESQGIFRKNGFLYLENQLGNPENLMLHVPGDMKRELRMIAPEELAAGMKVILKREGAADKEKLFERVLQLCGYDHMENAYAGHLENAYSLLQRTS